MSQDFCVKCMKPIAENKTCSCGFDKSKYYVDSYHLLPGSMLNDRYYVGVVLGEGGFGITYVGMDTLLRRKVAIKEYFLNGYANRTTANSTEIVTKPGEKQETFQKYMKGFLDEGRTMARFADSKYIVSIYDYFKANNTAYIVMEFLEGQTLGSYCKKKGFLSYEEMLEIFVPIMNVLEDIHQENVIHRDISPDNIIINPSGVAKLLDFGAARSFEKDEQRTMSIILKPGYAPMEQYRKKGMQGPWTDVYALCATMYYCMTGVVPGNAIERFAEDDVQPISDLASGCPRVYSRAIMKGMAVKIDDRYRSIKELRQALIGSYDDEEEAGNDGVGGKSDLGADNAETVSGDNYQGKINSNPDYRENYSQNVYGVNSQVVSQPYSQLNSQPYNQINSQPYSQINSQLGSQPISQLPNSNQYDANYWNGNQNSGSIYWTAPQGNDSYNGYYGNNGNSSNAYEVYAGQYVQNQYGSQYNNQQGNNNNGIYGNSQNNVYSDSRNNGDSNNAYNLYNNQSAYGNAVAYNNQPNYNADNSYAAGQAYYTAPTYRDEAAENKLLNLPDTTLSDKYQWDKIAWNQTSHDNSDIYQVDLESEIGEVVSFSWYRWRVLSKQDNRLMLIAEDCIVKLPYHVAESSIFSNVTWEESCLRKWLNTEFYNSFSDEEKNYIQLTATVNKDNEKTKIDAGKDTVDRVFLLSEEEAKAYYRSKGKVRFNGKECPWWLRTPGVTKQRAVVVKADGRIDERGNMVDTEAGVRPVIMISL